MASKSFRFINRFNEAVTVEVNRRFEEEVCHWATQDTGPFPNRAALKAQVQEEFQLLCRALGPLAALDPPDVFSASSDGPNW